jgi:hypothetical protein
VGGLEFGGLSQKKEGLSFEAQPLTSNAFAQHKLVLLLLMPVGTRAKSANKLKSAICSMFFSVAT